MSTRIIIFSRDRAMQLDALLASLKANMTDYALNEPPNIIWTASNDTYGQGYAHAMADHPDARFIREHDFQDDVEALLDTPDEFVMFMVDDDLLFRPTNMAHAVYEMERDDSLIAFSWRLGLNCVRCYPLDQPQRWPVASFAKPPIVTWPWQSGEYDASYPFSLDGHLLRADDVRSLLDGAIYTNPNEMEQTLAQRAYWRGTLRPRMASYSHSHLVGIPHNIVTTTHTNRHSGRYSTAELNGAYLEGARIDVHSMDFSRVDAAHSDVPYVFVGGEVAAA